MPRLFTAVDLSESVRKRALEFIEQLRPAASGVKWMDESQLHITLKFLGEVAEEHVPEIRDVMTTAARSIEPFEIEVAGAGSFPTLKRPNTLWLGVRQGSDLLDRLFRAIQRPLVKLRFPREERRFTPHLTLGRLKHGLRASAGLADTLQDFSDYSAGTSLINEVVLYESQLLPDGPIYRPLARARLGAEE